MAARRTTRNCSTCVAAGPQVPGVEVARQRGGQHEEHGVSGADLRREQRGQRQRAEPRRQIVAQQHRQRQFVIGQRRVRHPREHPEQGWNRREHQQDTGVDQHADPHRARVPRAVDLLQQPRRDDERRSEQGQVHHTGRAAREWMPVVGGHRRRQRRRKSAGGPCRGQRESEPGNQHDRLHGVDGGRGQQPARREVQRGDDAADDAPPCARHPGDGLEQSRERDQLRRENGQRPAPQEHRHESTHVVAETALEVIAERAMVVVGSDAPDARADDERQHDGAEPGRSDPPPRRDAIAVAEAGGTDRGPRPDVRGDERAGEQGRRKAASGDEEVGGRGAARRPPADEDEGCRVGKQ